MSPCGFQGSGDVEQYFYGELDGHHRRRVEEHLEVCRACRELLEELSVIRSALSTLPDVSAPPGGDWSRFMARLEAAVRPADVVALERRPAPRAHPIVASLAMAAMLALITMGVVTVLRDRDRAASLRDDRSVATSAPSSAPAPAAAVTDRLENSRLVFATEQHFERSKLVVLGLATKDPDHVSASDWDYERRLASNLLDDTRLYRQAAEERGMDAVAGIMRDLELVLLQASVGESSDPDTLAQIQRFIRKRDLVTKMNVLTTGL